MGYSDTVDQDGIVVHRRGLCNGNRDISQSWTSWMESSCDDENQEGLHFAGLDGLLADEDQKLRKESQRMRKAPKKPKKEKKHEKVYETFVLEDSPSFYRSGSFYKSE